MEKNKQIHLTFFMFGFLCLLLLTPHVCSAQPLRHLLERKEPKKKIERGGEQEQDEETES